MLNYNHKEREVITNEPKLDFKNSYNQSNVGVTKIKLNKKTIKNEYKKKERT